MFNRVALVAAVLSLFAASAVLGADAPAEKPEMAKVVGTVSVVKDVNDVVTAVMLTAKDATYSVTLDDKGMELSKLSGKEVEVQGKVSVKGDEKWIKVAAYKEIEKAK